jgi:hypothetical protein
LKAAEAKQYGLAGKQKLPGDADRLPENSLTNPSITPFTIAGQFCTPSAYSLQTLQSHMQLFWAGCISIGDKIPSVE